MFYVNNLDIRQSRQAKQMDRVAMRSPLGLALANIFIGYYEEKLFSQMQKPPTYFRYVDNPFAICDHKAEAD